MMSQAVAALLDRLGHVAAGNAEALTDEVGPNLDIPGLKRIAAAFELSAFEQALLVLVASVEFNGAMPAACAAANGDDRRPWPTFGLALAALTNPHWSAISSDGPLRRFRLVHVDLGESLTQARMRVDERILHALLGLETVDGRLGAHVLERRVSFGEVPPSQYRIVEQVAQHWSEAGVLPVVQLCGADGAQRTAVTDAIAVALGSGRVLEMSSATLPPPGPEQADLIGRLARECVLTGAIVAITASPTDRNECTLIEHLRATGAVPVVIESSERHAVNLAIPVHDVPTPTIAEQRQIWNDALPGLDGVGDRLAGQFVVTSTVARAVVDSTPPDRTIDQVWHACRRRLRSDVGGSALVREPSANWDKIVLPDEACRQLLALEVEARHASMVHEQWGLDIGGSRARGTSALFTGPSGTGKTLAAEVIANSLGTDLLHIDLSQVVNKYIGETEKNLARVFDAGERSGAVLLFDECDALFGKRTEIKDSHDRYANIEVSFLLQRMEAYSGVAILTTNLRANLDPAFVRRLRFIVNFPHPNREQRERIWARIFPGTVDTSGLDFALLAGLDITGGVIANIAMAAALRAAADAARISMNHVRDAAALEYAKLERPLTGGELAGWS